MGLCHGDQMRENLTKSVTKPIKNLIPVSEEGWDLEDGSVPSVS